MKKYKNIYETIIFFEANIFKNLGLLLVEIVFFIFQTLIQIETIFRSSEIVFFNESFILAGGNGFSVN